jgi:hypothetical protein
MRFTARRWRQAMRACLLRLTWPRTVVGRYDHPGVTGDVAGVATDS